MVGGQAAVGKEIKSIILLIGLNNEWWLISRFERKLQKISKIFTSEYILVDVGKICWLFIEFWFGQMINEGEVKLKVFLETSRSLYT